MSKMINDKECVLVEFCNEKNKPIQVGFQAWLQNKDNAAKDINKKVIIKWPINTTICCAKCMKRQLTNCKGLEWKYLVVKIIAIGEWTEMYDELRNIEQFRVVYPTKEDRHQLWRKENSDEESITSSSDSCYAGRTTRKQKEQYMPSREIVTKKNKNEMSSKQKIRLHMKEYNAASASLFSEDKISENENNDSTIKLLDKIKVLEEENKRLREENKELCNLRFVYDDLYKIKDISSDCQKNIHDLHTKIDMLLECKRPQKEVIASEVRVLADSEFFNIPDLNYDNNDRNMNKIADMEEINTEEEKLFSIVSEVKNDDLQSQMTSASHQSIIDFGGRKVEAEKINRINKAKGIVCYTTALMNVVFTSKEMATSTMTGTQSNFRKNKIIEGEIIKKELSPLIRNAIIDFIMQEYSIPDKSCADYKKIKNAMKAKLNNETAKFKRNNCNLQGTSRAIL